MADMRFIASIVLFAVGVVNAADRVDRENLGRIARGHQATAGQFPYAVRMFVEVGAHNRLCGAALIGSSWLLTAAHCFNDATGVEVYLGSVFMDSAEVAYNVPISHIVLHPLFNEHDLVNDIALLQIPPTVLCDHIGIVRLPKIEYSYPTYENEVALGSGWGALNDQYGTDRLHWGRMRILANEECAFASITAVELCTAISSDWATICRGDSGGPLVLESTGELVGVASSGDPESCERGDPAFFHRITKYLVWIKSVSGISYE